MGCQKCVCVCVCVYIYIYIYIYKIWLEISASHFAVCTSGVAWNFELDVLYGRPLKFRGQEVNAASSASPNLNNILYRCFLYMCLSCECGVSKVCVCVCVCVCIYIYI